MDTSGGAIKISVTDMAGAQQKLDEIIQSPARIYALTPEIIGKEGRAKIQSLFDGLTAIPIYEDHESWFKYDSPILAILPKEKSFFDVFLLQMANTLPCLLLSSSKDAHELKNFFQHRLKITAKASNGFLYRYYGVKLVKPFIDSVSARRAIEFFGPVEALVWPLCDMRGNLQWLSCSFPPQNNENFQRSALNWENCPHWKTTDEEWQRFEENVAEDVILTGLCHCLLDRNVDQLQRLSNAEIRKKVRGAIEKARTYDLFSDSDIRLFCELELGFYPGIFSHPQIAALLKDAKYPDRKTQEIVNLNGRVWRELMQFSEKYRANADPGTGLNKKRSHAVFRHTEKISEGPDGFYLQAPYNYLHKWCEAITEPIGHAGFTIALYFRGGHLPEIQSAVCECIREYANILGEKARCCLTPPGRLVIRGKRKLPLMDEKQVERRQKRRESHASFMICSNATRDEYERQPPKCMLKTDLNLSCEKPFYSVKENTPKLPSDIPLDRQISYIFASFEPSMFGIYEPHKPFAELALRWVQLLRPVSGIAGWGITRACDWTNARGVSPLIAPYLLRFPGLGWIPDTSFPFFMNKFTAHITDINWLTIINEELAARVGGIEKLRSLGKDCPIARYPGGYVIQAGERPEYGDMEEGKSLPLYGNVQNLLRPLYLPPDYLGYVTQDVIPAHAGPDLQNLYGRLWESTIYLYDFYEHWLHRFDKNWRPERA